MYKKVVSRLSDEDVDRIATRVVGKFVRYVLLLVIGIWVVPILMIGVLSFIGAATRDLPWLALPLATTALAGPVVLLIWLWGRAKRAR
jgi:hypothetical protein